MKKIVILIILLSLFNNETLAKNTITEEATPVRNDEQIEAMNYKIVINSNKDRIVYKTKLLDSINHYLDVTDKEQIYIKFKFTNNTTNNYYLKKIVIYDKKSIIKSYNYYKKIDDSEVDIVLDKNILSNTINNNKISGGVNVVIEKH
ncbi:MAG: hypothetical protein IKE63_02475 [Bacilli bacterium]|nr:hypothetical protein [Bacilli bacterium]